jgi:hypothetical protein
VDLPIVDRLRVTFLGMLVTKQVEYAEPMMTMHQERYSFQIKRDIKNLSRMNLPHKWQ